ncbi:MAG TPA: electron transfer flavoprotein subunit alpha/FixB family protein [Nocardioidaceae bacterium]|jgi:electron transfer flavoprotein alpha subunit|nr:electron transfer flavoprotein subunit alpha/FixB family protein [Nocardioidaceae bacterium]
MSAVLVLVETDGGGATEVSRETLTFVRGLGLDVHALVVGDGPPGLVDQLGAYGVTTVHHADGDAFTSYAAAAWAAAVVAAAGDATVVTAAGTPRGNEVLAHVACRLGVTMAANVVEVESVSPLSVSRQVLGGSALEEMRLEDAVAVFSVAGHACDPAEAESHATPVVHPLDVSVPEADLRARVVRTEPGEPDESGGLKSARVVVGAGRGAGGPDGFADLLELTELLGGSLGVSRVVTSLGWRPHHEQVGQTGSRVAPDLYVACGISGAIQHWAGMSSSKTILAINTDPDAPMVTKAHYAVIGDLHEIVPAVNEELRRRSAG